MGALYRYHAQAYAIGAALAVGQQSDVWVQEMPKPSAVDNHLGAVCADRDNYYLHRWVTQSAEYRGESDAAEKRARLYANRLMGTAQEGWFHLQAADAVIYWRLTYGAEHCPSCVELEKGNPWTAATLPTVPARGDCECLQSCRCWLETGDGLRSFEFT
jgi:hypothetical protein